MKPILAAIVTTLFTATAALAQAPAQVVPVAPGQAQADPSPNNAAPKKDAKAKKDGKKKGKKGKKKSAKPAKPQ